MMQINIRRCLSLMLAVVLTFSLLPVSALAEEEAETVAAETTSPTEATEAPTEAPEETTVPVTEETIPETTAPAIVLEETAPVVVAAADSNMDAVQATMDAILTKYLGSTAEQTEEDVAKAVADMDEDTWFEALIEVEDLENSDAVQALTEEDLQELTEKNPLFCAFAEAVYERASMPDEGNTYATTVSVLDGKITITDTANSIKASGNTVTVTASGGYFSQTTNTITITNASGADGTLGFTYSPSNYSSFTAFGGAYSSGSTYDYSGDISAGGTLSMSIKGKKAWSNNTATLTLNFISMAGAGEAYDVTFEYDSSLGTISVGEATSPTSGYKVEDISASTGIELTATASNSTFLGWVNETTHERLSTATSYTLKPSADCTVRAAFASKTSDAWFLVDNKYLTDDLTIATGLGTKIVSICDGVLQAGTYTIPSGDTLLIPFDDAHTLRTTTPATTDTFTKPSAYRTLTMDNGAKIEVEGAISLSGTQSAKFAYNGAPTGAVGAIKMKDGSSITVKNGGNLYAWGYIYSETKDSTKATVTVERGGTVYEDFQFTDWRGGDATSKMQNNEQRVFPMSQYYVQNIRVPMTLKSGASEKGYTSVNVTLAGVQSSSVPFIGSTDSGSMFILTSGSLTKDYQESKDRLVVTVEGDIQLSSYSITLQGVTINSANYVLPITNNLTAHIKSGTLSVTQDIALLPGSELIINEGATCKLVKTGNVDTNLFVYDLDEWGNYCGSANKLWMISQDTFERKYTRVDADLKDAVIQIDGTLDATAGYVYTTNSAANIHSTKNGVAILPLVGTKTVTYQGTQYSEKGLIGTSYYVEYDTGTIGITPAKLMHGDGTYLATGDAAGTYYYHATHQKWVKGGHTDTSTEEILPTCTDQGYTDHTCTCGYDYKDTYVEALGHTGGTANCVDKAICTRCSTAYGDIDSTKHKTPVADAAKDPTCTETGLTAGSHCSACNAVIVGQEELAALGHKYDSGTETPPAASKEGFITYTCQNDSTHTKTETINVAQVGEKQYTILDNALNEVPENGTVTLLHSIDGGVEIDKAMTIQKGSYEANILPATGYYISEETNTTVTIQKRIIAGTSIRAGDCLDIYFWVTGLEGNGYTAKFSDGSTIPAEKWITDETTGMRRFAFKGITAKRMTETVSVTIYDSEGNPVSETATESIEGYALRTLEKNSNTELRTALVDMLNYGADAQTYFNHNTTTLANAKLTEAQKGYGTSTDAVVENDMKKITETGDISFVGASVTAGNELYLSFYFIGLEERSNIKAVVTYTDHYGNQRTREIAGSSFVSTSGYWGPQVTGLAVADGRRLVNCKIYNGSTLVAEAECSIEGYAAKTIADNENNSEKTALVAVCKSLMRFVDSAYAYFH